MFKIRIGPSIVECPWHDLRLYSSTDFHGTLLSLLPSVFSLLHHEIKCKQDIYNSESCMCKIISDNMSLVAWHWLWAALLLAGGLMVDPQQADPSAMSPLKFITPKFQCGSCHWATNQCICEAANYIEEGNFCCLWLPYKACTNYHYQLAPSTGQLGLIRLL